MSGEQGQPLRRGTVDVALEARVRRWTVNAGTPGPTLLESAIVAADEPTDDPAPLRVSYGEHLRVAVLSTPEAPIERALRRAVLASGAELVLLLRSNDPRSFVERAEALRAAAPDLVLALVGERRDADGAVELVEALRAGCAGRSPAPRVVVAGDARSALRLKHSAAGLAVELLPDPQRREGITAFAHRAREFRRGTRHGAILRDEALEDLARLIASAGTEALVVDVSGGSTSVVRAGPDGSVVAAHVAPLGAGIAADRTVVRAGLDGVRRWIPWGIDGPTLLERVFNRARWPDAVPAEASALALEVALAHEALAHVIAEAEAAGIADLLRDAPLTVVTGTAASFTRAAHTALVVIDGLSAAGPTTLYRDREEALVALGAIAARARAGGNDPSPTVAPEVARLLAPLAFVVPVTPARRSRLRVDGNDIEGEPLGPGAFFSVPHSGAAHVEITGTTVDVRGTSGPLGIIIDARGRPLPLPPRDAERIPTIVRWFAALDQAAASAG
ncbi:MAG TPA: hypothetical protein VHG53_00865 [Candidatus Limnocylindria bacterium]|nr:hypothetical protein [Candidatus Limnocylindria bacterium]